MALRDLDIDVDIDVDESGLSEANRKVDQLVDNLQRLDDFTNLKIDVDLGAALAQLETLDEQIESLRNKNIDIEVDTMDAVGELAALEAILKDLERDKVKIRFDANLAAALADLAALETMVEALSRERYTINLDVDSGNALADLAAFESLLEGLGHDYFDINLDVNISRALVKVETLREKIHELDNMTINIDIDIGAAATQLAALQNQMTMLRMQRHIDIDMDVAAAMAQVAALQAQIAALQAQAGSLNLGGGLGGGMGGGGLAVPGVMAGVKIVGLAIALPALISVAQVAIGAVGTLGVAIGVLGGAVLALGSALAIGGAGLMGFSAIAISSISALYEEKAKLNAQQLQLKAQTDKVADSWGKLKEAMQPTVLSATTSGVKAINTLLEHGQPILQAAGKSVSGLMDGLNKSLKTKDFTGMFGFFNYLERNMPVITTSLGNGFGNALRGVANTMTAFAPLTNWMARGFENMMGRFGDWTSGLKDSPKMTAFIDYVKTNLPTIGDALGDASKGVVKFFAAFDVTAEDGLDWFAGAMEDFSNWAGDLDNNEGFQKLLKEIKADGPEVAKIIGDVTDNILKLSSAISGLGRDENGEGGILSWLSNGLDNFDFEEFFSWDGLWDYIKKGPRDAALDALGIDIDWSKILGFDKIGELFGDAMNGLGKWFDDIEISVGDWFKDLDFGGITRGLTEGLGDWFSNLNIGEKIGNMFSGAGDWFDGIEKSVGDWFKGLDFGGITRGLIDDVGKWFSNINIGESISGMFKNFDLGKINWKDFIPDFKWPDFGKFDFKSLVPDFKWPDFGKFDFKSLIPSFKWPDLGKIDFKSLIPKFKWPSIGSFSWNSFISKFKWPSIGSFSWSGFISKFKWPSIGSFSWSKFIAKFNWPKAPAFSWSNFISKFKWPKLPSLSWSSYISKFNWPKLPSFSWSSFISKFSWPKLPSFSWSSFIPKFSWPKISMPKISIPGFSSGLGRVPGDMTANIHKDEAVLPAHQASKLRDLGVIQGEGRYPDLNLDALNQRTAIGDTTHSVDINTLPTASDTKVVATATSPTTSSATQQPTSVTNNIEIIVQGGNTNNETAGAVKSAIEEVFADLRDVFPAVREG